MNPDDRDRARKMLALAMHPTTPEPEALNALRRLHAIGVSADEIVPHEDDLRQLENMRRMNWVMNQYAASSDRDRAEADRLREENKRLRLKVKALSPKKAPAGA